jgi:FSR family fosmidomycin resistance protein-like MFS transporter
MSSGPSVLNLETQALAARASRAGIVSLVLLSLGHFCVDLYSGALGAFQPVLVDKLGLSLTQAGILGGAFVFSSSVTQPVYGILSDRFRTSLIAGLAPAAAGLFISTLGLAPGYTWLVAMAMLGGAGVAAFHPQASSRATAGVPGNRGHLMAIFISSGTLGMALGPTYFSALLTRLGLARTSWGALPGVVVTVLLVALLPAAAPSIARAESAFDWKALRSVRRPLTILFFLVFIRSIVQVTFAQLLPLYLHLVRGQSVTDASLTLSLYLTFGAVGGFTGGHLSDRLGGRTVILISMISCVPFLALFFLTHGALSLLGLLLGGLTLLFTIPVNVVMAQELVPSQAGTVSALMMGFAWGTAGMIFIPLTGWASDHFGMQAALSALTLFPLVGFFLTLKLPKGL